MHALKVRAQHRTASPPSRPTSPEMTAKGYSPRAQRASAHLALALKGRPRVRAALLVTLGAILPAALFALFARVGLVAARGVPSAVRAGFSPATTTASATDTVGRLEQWQDRATARSRLRVFVYDLPKEFNTGLVARSHRTPPRIRDPFCDTSFYSAEVHIHRRMLSSPVRTMDPAEADLFYVPIYPTCDLMVHQPNDLNRNGRHFARAMQIVRNEHPHWNATAGRDHIFMFAQGFGARLAGKQWPDYRNAIFLVHNGEFTAPEYTPRKDLVVPPQLRTYLLPAALDSRPPPKRKYLAQFGGQVVRSTVTDHRGSNYSGGVRQFVQKHLAGTPGYRVTGVRARSYLDDMRRSKFCLAPEGWHPWSPRPYYAVLLGCIPVVISERQELAFEDMVPYDDFVVWVRPSEIAGLDAKLRAISAADVARRQAAMHRYWRLFWYGRGGLAFESILDELHRRKHISHMHRSFS